MTCQTLSPRVFNRSWPRRETDRMHEGTSSTECTATVDLDRSATEASEPASLKLGDNDPAVGRPGPSVGLSPESFDRAGLTAPSSVQHHLPARRIIRRTIAHHPPPEELEKWATEVGILLGSLVPSYEARIKVLQLLHQYKHLNGNDLTDLPCSDIITHHVRIKPGAKPASAARQKRWPAHTEWWLRKLVQDGLEGDVYESTAVIGRLSQWNARAVLVDKVENPQLTDEPRLMFN